MDFNLTPRQEDLRQRSRRFAVEVLAPLQRDSDRLPTPEERFLATKPAYEQLISSGYLRTCIPVSVGGDNESLLDTAVVAEELYAENASLALTLFGTLLGLTPVTVGGTSHQQQRLLAPFLLTTGAPLAAFCSTEPGGSANAASPAPAPAPAPGDGVRTVAVRDGDTWTINGRKAWASSASGWRGQGADLLCVVSRTDMTAPSSAGVFVIAVQGPVQGFVLEKVIDTPGHRSHLLPQFSLNDTAAHHENLLGVEGEGLQLFGASFGGASALVGSFAVALMRSAFSVALEFARRERRGGVHPVLSHQAVGYALADAKTTIEAARSLSWRACHAVDAGHPTASELASHSKIFGSEAAVRVLTSLMQVVGVESYDNAHPLSGLMQDALALPLLGGGNLGVRRRQLHHILAQEGYDHLPTSGR